jgi:geranylgeranyl diphosphate synthase type I
MTTMPKEGPGDTWPLIRSLIDEVLSESWMNPFTAEMIRYQTGTGGKRIRPAIVLGVHRAFGGDDAKALPFAAAVEIIHNASLVHDDIQDRDEQRRGRPSAWMKYSTDQAINLGDILFTLAFEVFMRSPISDRTKLEIVRLTMRAVAELVNGQVQEIVFRRGGEISVDDYLAMVNGKTGSLFRLASHGAYVLTENGADGCIEDLRRLGSCLGSMFQVRDDIIDIFGLKEGREPGCDVMEGKISVLTSISMARLDPDERRDLLTMLCSPRERKDKALVEKVAGLYRRTGAYREAYDIYQRERQRVFSIPVMKDNKRLEGFVQEIVDHLSVPLDRLSPDF